MNSGLRRSFDIEDDRLKMEIHDYLYHVFYRAVELSNFHLHCKNVLWIMDRDRNLHYDTCMIVHSARVYIDDLYGSDYILPNIVPSEVLEKFLMKEFCAKSISEWNDRPEIKQETVKKMFIRLTELCQADKMDEFLV